MSDEERFLSRWMRRKAAARQEAEAPAPVQDEPIPAESAASPQPLEGTEAAVPNLPPAASDEEHEPPLELPSIDSLQGIASDYGAFMRAGVDEQTRGAALKKLFSDPHFHFDQMDKLDIYIDDYGKPDPIPPAMLAGLEQARSLLFSKPAASAEEGAPTTVEALADDADQNSARAAEAPQEILTNESLGDAESGEEVDQEADEKDTFEAGSSRT